MSIKIIFGVYGGIAFNQGIITLSFSIFYIIALGILSYHIYTHAGILSSRFSRIIEIGPIFGIWFGVCSLLEQVMQAHDPLGIYLLFIGAFFVPNSWAAVRNQMKLNLLTSNYKAIHSINKCMIYNYECAYLANNC